MKGIGLFTSHSSRARSPSWSTRPREEPWSSQSGTTQWGPVLGISVPLWASLCLLFCTAIERSYFKRLRYRPQVSVTNIHISSAQVICKVVRHSWFLPWKRSTGQDEAFWLSEGRYLRLSDVSMLLRKWVLSVLAF
jgi:hypothetical protein